MTEEQRKRFDELLMIETQKRGGLSIVDIMMLKEAFYSCEIERNSSSETRTTNKEGTDETT